MELMGRIWGPYSSAANKALLIKRNSDSDINTSMADLRGQRVVWVSETSTADKFDGGAVKYLTGMDTISARRLHEGFRRFEPTHHVIMSTNHKPGADSTNNAFWSRMTMVPFRLSFVENPKPNTHERLVDKNAKDRILKNERDVIFLRDLLRVTKYNVANVVCVVSV
jgi:putative DNA primase/helicase